jgi:hypothetical protein
VPTPFDQIARKLAEIKKTEGELTPLLDFYQQLINPDTHCGRQSVDQYLRTGH